MRWPFALTLALAVVLVTAVTPALGQETFSLDNPISAFAPAASRQPATAAVQTLGTRLGSVRIPAIGVDHEIFAGVDLSVLSEGPGHWVGTARPGGAGNMVLAGHRTTHGAPFGDIDKLQRGDLILFDGRKGLDIMYSVTETFVVTPEALWITYETGDSIATLFACHPKGSARQRIVVRAKLVGDGRIA
jgi:sortase A